MQHALSCVHSSNNNMSMHVVETPAKTCFLQQRSGMQHALSCVHSSNINMSMHAVETQLKHVLNSGSEISEVIPYTSCVHSLQFSPFSSGIWQLLAVLGEGRGDPFSKMASPPFHYLAPH